MKNAISPKTAVNNVAKMQLPTMQKKISSASKKQKYVYTEKDLGEGLLYMGLSTPAYYASR